MGNSRISSLGIYSYLDLYQNAYLKSWWAFLLFRGWIMKTESDSKNIGGKVTSPSTKQNDDLANYSFYLYSKLDKSIFSNKAHNILKIDSSLK